MKRTFNRFPRGESDLGCLVLIVLVVGGYFAWTHREQLAKRAGIIDTDFRHEFTGSYEGSLYVVLKDEKGERVGSNPVRAELLAGARRDELRLEMPGASLCLPRLTATSRSELAVEPGSCAVEESQGCTRTSTIRAGGEGTVIEKELSVIFTERVQVTCSPERSPSPDRNYSVTATLRLKRA